MDIDAENQFLTRSASNERGKGRGEGQLKRVAVQNAHLMNLWERRRLASQ